MGANKYLDVKPWNDIFYNWCFYNPLLSGIYYHGGNIFPILTNDYCVYRYNEYIKFSKLIINFKQVEAEIDILKKIGINVNNNFINNNLINEIKEAINNNQPVMVPIDRYYWRSLDENENFRFYNKIHEMKFFLIIGYDDNTKLFNIIEVNNATVKCIKNQVEYDSLTDSYLGFLNWDGEYGMWKPDFKVFSLYRKNNQVILIDDNFLKKYKLIYKRNFIKYREQVINGFDEIKKSIKYFEDHLSDVQSLLNNYESIKDIVFYFNLIEKAKVAEMYKANIFFKNEKELLKDIMDIYKYLTIIRGISVKIAMKKTIQKELVLAIINRLNCIYNLENKCNDKIHKIFNKFKGD